MGGVCVGTHAGHRQGGRAHMLNFRALIAMVDGRDCWKLLDSGQS